MPSELRAVHTRPRSHRRSPLRSWHHRPQVGHISRRAPPAVRGAENSLAAELLVLLLRSTAADLQRRPDRPRRYAIYADPLGSELLGQRLHVIHRRGFGLSIVV